MTDILPMDQVPMGIDSDGVIRVGGTRVTLDVLIEAFREGATAEEIAQQYPTLTLADVYQVIGYYLRHSDRLNGYLQDRELVKAQVRLKNESSWPAEGIRERLLARQQRVS